MMNPEVKERWVKALRSGDYEQGEGTLYQKTDNTYCCLGVLCKIEGYSGDAAEMFVSEKDSKSIGITYQDQVTLSNMNDGHMQGSNGVRSSFFEIADYIEENL